MGTVAIFGDVAGQLAAFEAGLAAVGVDLEQRCVPEGLVVIQVGDLVHRGPDSAGVVRLASALLERSDGRYVQLVGNHEAQYLTGFEFYDGDLGAVTVATLRDWWAAGLMGAAVAVQSDEGPLLVTHAGLTVHRWHLDTGSAVDVAAAAVAVNKAVRSNPADGFAPGSMLSEPGQSTLPNPAASVVWAECTGELYAPWATAPVVPFGQVHGHSSPVFWSRSGESRKGAPTPLMVDKAARLTRAEFGGRPFWGVDPCWGAYARTAPQPALALNGSLAQP